MGDPIRDLLDAMGYRSVIEQEMRRASEEQARLWAGLGVSAFGYNGGAYVRETPAARCWERAGDPGRPQPDPRAQYQGSVTDVWFDELRRARPTPGPTCRVVEVDPSRGIPPGGWAFGVTRQLDGSPLPPIPPRRPTPPAWR